jgi:outer membrane protein OmpA-like peptidoglycan-associated protein
MKLKKRVIVSAACTLGLVGSGFAQDFPGYRTGNYNGVNGVFFNPANVVDSRYRWDVNLLSISANVGSNNAEYRVKDIGNMFKNDSTLMNQLFPSSGKPTNALGNVALNLPSVMFNINSKNSMAVTTRFRALVNADDVDSRLVNAIRNNQIDFGNGYTVQSNTNSRLNVNGWGEVGLTYGHVFMDKGKHFFKAGITPRYIWGVGNDYARINNLTGTLKTGNDGDTYLNGPASGTFGVGSGGLHIDKNMGINELTQVNGKGWGGDIGFVYEFRPDYAQFKNADGSWMRDKTKYKLKIGASLLDYGKIKFDRNMDASGGYNVNVPTGVGYDLANLKGNNIGDIKKSIDETGGAYFTKNANEQSATYKVSLPTTVQLDVDYRVANHFYVNAMGILSTVKNNDKVYNSKYYNSITVTPRYEGRVFDFYLPVSYNALTKFNAGAGFRVGPVFAGTGSGLSALITKSKQADVYFGVHLGILHKAKKVKELPVVVNNITNVIVIADSDGDGVPDNEDKCPGVKGLVKYQGCPIPDSDGDGVNDEEDKCPTVPGMAKYHGCPVPDTDGDGVNDEQDQCPTIPGFARYHGCPIPDTDGDGLNDEVDKCPTVAGPKENQGCPEIKKETIAKVEKAAKNIFFQTGKAVILAKSNAQLNEVVKVLNEDPSLNLDIKGHTDNVGKPANNQKLSQQRADAVKAYFVKKGISESRLTSTGYGDAQPIAPNTTAAGRQKNRRVEMMLKNY